MATERGYIGVLQVEDPNTPDSWLDIAGQDSASLDESSDTEDVTSKPPLGTAAGAFKTEQATTRNFVVSSNGKTDFSDPGFMAWYNAGRAQTAVKLRLVLGINHATSTDTSTVYMGYTFSAIPSFSQEFPVAGVVTYSVTHLLQDTPVYADNITA